MVQEKHRPRNVETSLEKRNETTAQKKKRFLTAYVPRMCNVAKTCEVVGISRQTLYRWRDTDDVFKKALTECEETLKDDLETTMMTRAIVDKSDTMLIWLSKTKMKDRGYVEKIENDVTVNPFLELMKKASGEQKDEK